MSGQKKNSCGCENSSGKFDENEGVSRRKFLAGINKLLISGVLAVHGWIVMRFLLAPGLETEPTQIVLGNPDEIPEGLRYYDQAKLFLIRQEDQVQAMSAKCTHLGCVLEHVADGASPDGEFHCPCHNSKFDGAGKRIAGPAQKSLERFAVRKRLEDDQLVVDFSQPADEGDWYLLV